MDEDHGAVVLHYRKNLLLAASSDAWQLIIESTHCVFLLYFLYKLAITNLYFIRVTGNDCSVSFIIKISQGGFSFEKRIQFKAASGLCRWLQVAYHSVMDFKCNQRFGGAASVRVYLEGD